MSYEVEDTKNTISKLVIGSKNPILYNLQVAKSRGIKKIYFNFYSGDYQKTGAGTPTYVLMKVLNSLGLEIRKEYPEFKKLKFKIEDKKNFTVYFTY